MLAVDYCFSVDQSVYCVLFGHIKQVLVWSFENVPQLCYIYMGHWEQEGKNLNYMVRIFSSSRVDTDILLHQSG